MELPACALMLREKRHWGPDLLEDRGVCNLIMISSLPQSWEKTSKRYWQACLKGVAGMQVRMDGAVFCGSGLLCDLHLLAKQYSQYGHIIGCAGSRGQCSTLWGQAST